MFSLCIFRTYKINISLRHLFYKNFVQTSSEINFLLLIFRMVVASTCRPRYTSSQERILVYSSTPPLDITARVRIPLRTTAMWKSQPELFPSKGALGGPLVNPFTISQFYNLFGLFLKKKLLRSKPLEFMR